MAGKTFFAMLAAGAAFIAIGIAASVYSGVSVDVPLDGTLAPGLTDELSPEMNAGDTAALQVRGSVFNVEIKDPDGQLLTSQANQTQYSYELTAAKAGEYRFMITNTGSEQVTITGHAKTKASPLGFSGPLLLVVTGIIVVGLSLRFRNR